MNKLKFLSWFALTVFSATAMWAANPIGSIDAVTGKHGSITVNGWAIDPDNGSATVEVHVYLFSSETETDLAKAVKGINGTYANLDRPDLKGDWGSSVGELYGTVHGFDRTIDLYNIGVGAGTYYVRIYALNVAGSGNSVGLTYSSDGVSVVKKVSVADPYTVKYNANGGSGAPADQKKVQGINLTLSSTTPTRTGYTFNNWNTKQDGSGQSYAKGATYTTDLWSPTLYAQWTIVNYTIGYTLNSGSVSGNPTSYNVETATFTLKNPTRTGYTFKGWTGSNGSTPQTSVSIAKGSTGNKTYTANWTPENYTISYTLNDGSVSGNPTSYNIETATFTLKTPTRTGYTFKGWTGSNGNTPQTTVQIAKGSTGNKTYTANWTLENYTISYDLKDGTVTGNPTSYDVTTNAITLNNPTRTGYVFLGWTGSNGTTPQTTVTIAKGSTGNKSYTANWVPLYNITYDYNEGKGTNPATYSQISENFQLTAPTRLGYTFIGWTGSNGDVPQLVVEIAKGSTGDKNYVANWTINPSTNVSYLDSLGNKAAQETAAFNRPEAPEVEGFTFVRWEVKEGPLSEGIKLQAIYTENEPSGAPKKQVGKFTLIRKEGAENEYILQTAK